MFNLGKIAALAAPLALAVGLVAPAAATAQVTPFIGQIQPYGNNFCPRGWTGADGQLLPISQYTALFSLYGTTFGGDGRTTFGLPDLRSREVMHEGNGPGLTPRLRGARLGVESVTLLAQQLPSHNHQIAANNATGDSGRPGNDFLATPHANAPGDPLTDITRYASTAEAGRFMHPNAMTNNGGNLSHDNVPPTLVIRYCVALEGIFPSRN
ncbi:MAG: tail fiber protein [Sulfitobacter sp.]